MDEKSNKDINYYDHALWGKFSSNLVGFSRYLRSKGLSSSVSEQKDAMRALEKLDFQDENAFRLILRITLAKSTHEQEIFDKYFHSFWYSLENYENLESTFDSINEEPLSNEFFKRSQKSGVFSINELLDREYSLEEESVGYSPFETNLERAFTSFKAEEIPEIISMISEIGKKLATRLSYRKIISNKKKFIDFRRTIRNSIRRGGEIFDLFYFKKKYKRLKLVLICDVSKSMNLYSRFLIQFIYAFQSVFRRIESFVFSTSLHRITETFKTEEINKALDILSISLPGWSGGTKIGYSLDQFVENYGKKLLDSQTICLIISDGWDTGDIELLDKSMSYLKKRSKNIIWLNPLKGNHEYEPLTKGMQAALPYIDIFSSAHNINSLKQLARKVAKN